jgi:hypothetical protein
MLTPHRLELGAELAQLLDEGLHFCGGAGSCCVRSQGRYRESSDGFVYQVTLTSARWATSSRRRPGVRLRVEEKPSTVGSRLART